MDESARGRLPSQARSRFGFTSSASTPTASVVHATDGDGTQNIAADGHQVRRDGHRLGRATWDSAAFAATSSDTASVGDAVVNVQAFGAVGDGLTDDTAAIVAAVAAAFDPAANGRNHVFPAGTYVVSQAIKLDYGIVVEGAGQAASIIRMNPSVLSNMFVGSGGFPVAIEFRNIQLDGGYDWIGSKLQVPAASGSTTVSGNYLPGVFYQRIQVGAPDRPHLERRCGADCRTTRNLQHRFG